MTGFYYWVMLAVTLSIAITLQLVTSQHVPFAGTPKDRSDEYMVFAQKKMIELMRKRKASEAVISQLNKSKPWIWRLWDQNTKSREFDTIADSLKSTYRSRLPIGGDGNVGTVLSLTNCFMNNLATGWFRVGDVIMKLTPTRADLKFMVANRLVKADCDYWFLGAGQAKGIVDYVEIEVAGTLKLVPGETPRITSAKVRQFSGLKTDFGQGFWAPGINWVVGFISSYSQDRIVTYLEQTIPGRFQNIINDIKLPA